MADEVTPPGTPTATPPGTPTRKPRGKQLAILLIGGPVLAFGGCALFLSTVNFNSGAAGAGGLVFGLMFCVGLGMFAIGCVIAVAVVVQSIYDAHEKKSGGS
jgi:hypothetical protein